MAHTRLLIGAVLLLVASACASGLQSDSGSAAAAGEAAAAGAEADGGEQAQADFGRDKDVSIIVVTHGQASDPFWSVVKNGVDQAARDYEADVQYQAPETFDMVQMGQLIDGAVAQQPDGIAVSIPDPDALRGPISNAVNSGIPVVSLNSGQEVAQQIGVLAHIGQSEEEAGFEGGKRLAEAGLKKGLCINHEQGNAALELRCGGFIRAVEEAGGSAEQLAVDGTDPTGAQQRVEARLRQDSEINGGLAVGPLGMGPTLQALRSADRLKDSYWGSFDLGSDILKAVSDGNLQFAIDQQQYLQGYWAVEALVQNARIGVRPVGVVKTGPAFVTKGQAEGVLQLTEEGIR
jgi:simple sugar transport system substrate-binding protein